MAAFTGQAVDAAGHGEHFAPLLGRMPDGVQRPGIAGRLDHNHSQREPRDNAVSLGKQPGQRGLVERVLAHDGTLPGNFGRQFGVLGRVHMGQPGRLHGNGAPPRSEGPAMGRGVDPPRQPAHDGEAGPGERSGQFFGDLATVQGAAS